MSGHVITILVLLLYILFLPCTVYSENKVDSQFRLSSLLKTRAPIASIEVKNAYPHDAGAFTQGLFFHQGYLYESTGLNGKSFLYKKDVKTGKILKEAKINEKYFGEGIVFLKNKIYQLTWKNETVLIYEARSFQLIGKIDYHGEGWGVATDGRYLLMSDGSSTITVRHPDTFAIIREIHVHDGDVPVGGLNELEFIRGEIWANVFMEDVIVRISPTNGKVNGWIDLSILRTYLSRNAQVDVINGIAYDAQQDRIFLTGKYWPSIFEIRLVASSRLNLN